MPRTLTMSRCSSTKNNKPVLTIMGRHPAWLFLLGMTIFYDLSFWGKGKVRHESNGGDQHAAVEPIIHFARAGVYTASIPIYHPGIIPLNQI